MTDNRARQMWKTLEPFHAISYFAPETRQATDALGLKGGWMSYFGCRAAPLGTASAELVAAVFYNFHPAMVARSVPDAWERATPGQLLEARLAAVDSAVRRLFDPLPSFERVAEVARRAAEAAPLAGRPLGAANAALDWPDEPHLVLWQATTILRESRGDGHVAALVAAGLSPCQALVTAAAVGGPTKETFDVARRWSSEEWTAAEDDLRSRGLLDAAGALTDAGQALRQQVEDTTDALAETGWRALGDDLTTELHDLVHPLSAVLMSSALVPPDNPMGLRWS
ncbi:hypothetical protein ACFCV3_25680 [Kribbella sp. NPDC056345]|uniref:SCO6745 family protein n=1 Tax=Kribbella sp. NPDC056345 TaxID=3345789 RepID=UPI0035DF459C